MKQLLHALIRAVRTESPARMRRRVRTSVKRDQQRLIRSLWVGQGRAE